VKVRFLGSGDAFGSGGRFQTCIHLESAGSQLLVDCGTSSLIAMRRFGVDPLALDAVILSHLHGDHFGGVPFLILDGQFRRRTRPLVVAGPPGVEARVREAMEVLFPGSSRVERRFEIRFVELTDRGAFALGPVSITAYEVVHASGAPPFALRITAHGKTVGYSGDTEWTESLIDAARGAARENREVIRIVYAHPSAYNDDDRRGGGRCQADQDAGAALRHAPSVAPGPCETRRRGSYTS